MPRRTGKWQRSTEGEVRAHEGADVSGGGMTTGAVRASSEWLRLREPADAAARASELAEKVRSYLPTRGGATIHDLGCGTGSMARWLAVRLPGPQHWVMYDRDDELLTLADAGPPDSAL